QGVAGGAFLKLQGHYAHADQVGTVNALEPFSGNRFHSCQCNAFGGPVPRRTLAVVCTGDNDQRLLALHVGFDGFPHAHDLSFWLHTGQGALHHFAVFVPNHFVEQFRVSQGGTLGSQVVTPVGGVGVKVFLRQAHLVQVLTGCRVHHDGVGRRQVIRGDVIGQDGQRAHALKLTFSRHGAFPVRRAANVGGLWAPLVQRAFSLFDGVQV